MPKRKTKTKELWLESTTSTMSEARKISQDVDFCLVVTNTQTRGRGTRGRTWLCEKGNIFLTMAVRHALVSDTGINTVPLLVGIQLHNTLISYINSSLQKKTRLKWPNDLLIKEKKISGILIETHGHHYLIGIGINTLSAPRVADQGRPSICLKEVCKKLPANKSIVLDFYQSMQRSILDPPSNRDIILQWSALADWSQKIFLRSKPQIPHDALELNLNGQLKVRDPEGNTRWLTSEYLW